MSKGYYGSICSKFWDKADNKFQTNKNLNDINKPIEKQHTVEEIKNEDVEFLSPFIGNKRDAKELAKLHEDVMDYFISQSQGSDIRTIKNIGSSISEFIAYESTLDPKELANFIKFKFKEWKPYRMSQMEHARDWNLLAQHLIKFMEVLYQEELTKYTFDLSFINSNTLTPYKLFLVYDQLLSYNQFQDTLIINLLYTLCINIKILTLLEYTDIDLNKIISFYDFSVNDIRKVAIPVDLLNKILYFKRYQSIKNSFRNIKTKNQEIKQKNKRSFIIQISKSMIFKRFKEKFDGKISWFEHTPRNILLL